MAVLHFFLVNSTLIYILFSLFVVLLTKQIYLAFNNIIFSILNQVAFWLQAETQNLCKLFWKIPLLVQVNYRIFSPATCTGQLQNIIYCLYRSIKGYYSLSIQVNYRILSPGTCTGQLQDIIPRHLYRSIIGYYSLSVQVNYRILSPASCTGQLQNILSPASFTGQ